MTVLPDTSIWVAYFRRGHDSVSDALDDLVKERRVVICGPVVGEILAGTQIPQREQVWETVASLTWADLDRRGWRRAGEAASDLLRSGRAVPLTDISIAVAAIDADAAVWTTDSDFERIQEVLPELRLHHLQ